MPKILVLPGDGIGPEIVPEAVKVLEKVAPKFGLELEFQEGLIGGAAIDRLGKSLPDETLEASRASDAVLLGAVGGPKWDTLPAGERPEVAALLPLRKGLGLYANIRPCLLYSALADSSTLKKEVIEGTDLIVIRELTGGLYFGKKSRETYTITSGDKTETAEKAIDTLVYTTPEIKRILALAFDLAKKRSGKVTSVDKANVLESSRLWRETAEKMIEEYPEINLEHIYVDNCAMQLVRDPKQFDVIVTENTFGDILSDQASMLSGSIGMLPSASIGGEVALYEPSHGSAPDIAGKDLANPIATILSAAMMLEITFDLPDAAQSIRKAVGEVLEAGYRTGDIMSPGCRQVGTAQMGALIRERL